MTPLLRLRLGNYEPLLELATGGMAVVYVARQVGAGGFERLVVIKRVHPHLLADRDFHDMFRDEGRVAAMLHHPNVVAVTDVVELDGELFLVMEYVESTSLSSLLSAARSLGQRLPPGVVSRIILDTLSGLHAAHEAVDIRGHGLEIVHRDVSPQNVVVGVDGSSRLIDFGVAKARHRLTETRSGSLKGKHGYMAPEQAKAIAVDRRADVFSAGVVLWEALVGERLFRGENELDTMARVQEQPIPLPSTQGVNVPPGLDAVVMKALERDRDRRYRTAAEFLEELETALPPAAPRDVAAVVKAFCGDRIDARRKTLQSILDGQIQPLSAVSPSGAARARATIPDSPESRDRLQHSGRDEGTEGRITATRDPPSPRHSVRGRALTIGAVAVVALALVVAGAVVVAAGRRSKDVPNLAAAPRPSAVAADELSLDLDAPSTIASLRTPGLRSSRLDGTSARIVVARWAGELPIDVVLADGRSARVVALSDGPRELLVVPAPSTPPSASPPATTAPPPHAAPPPRPAPASPATPELHKSPYGP
jgi:eukaryotic-like serine/threonine-protein kinase